MFFAVSLGFGGFLFVVGLGWNLAIDSVRKHGITTTARVLYFADLGRADKVILEFETRDGQHIRTETDGGIAKPVKAGDVIPLVYDATDPDNFYDPRRGVERGLSLLIFTLGTGLLVLGAQILFRGIPGWLVDFAAIAERPQPLKGPRRVPLVPVRKRKQL